MKISRDASREMLNALARGGLSDMRLACDLADKIVDAVERVKDFETLKKGFVAFRARNDYVEDDTSRHGCIEHYPLSGEDICAPPKGKTQLGRFNAARHPVLYLSTSREVAIAESRALSSDICTVAVFKTKRSIRLAKLLKKSGTSLGLLFVKKPNEEDIDKDLLHKTAEFISRRVPDIDREMHYRTCNLIASALKERGFDALAYRTSFWSDGWRIDGRSEEEESIFSANLAMFNPEDATPVNSALYHIDWKRPTASKVGNAYWQAKP